MIWLSFDLNENTFFLQGKYCEAETSEPNNCPKGTYGANTGLTAEGLCTACPGGKYCDSAGRLHDQQMSLLMYPIQ